MDKTAGSMSLASPAAEMRALRPPGRECLRPEDSAFSAITDFERDYPHTMRVTESVEHALARMMQLGDYSLLVVRPDPAGRDPQVVGLITLFDIYRAEKERCAQTSTVHLDELSVEHVMTPWTELPLVKYESLQLLTVRDVFDMFQGTNRTHLLVIEKAERHEEAVARGMIARGTLAKWLRRGQHQSEVGAI
jgi:CBS domain-containing protein